MHWEDPKGQRIALYLQEKFGGTSGTPVHTQSFDFRSLIFLNRAYCQKATFSGWHGSSFSSLQSFSSLVLPTQDKDPALSARTHSALGHYEWSIETQRFERKTLFRFGCLEISVLASNQNHPYLKLFSPLKVSLFFAPPFSFPPSPPLPSPESGVLPELEPRPRYAHLEQLRHWKIPPWCSR